MKTQILGVWVLHETGPCLFHFTSKKLGLNENLFSGFLSAILMSVPNALKQNPLDLSLQSGKLFLSRNKMVVFALLALRKAKKNHMESILENIQTFFLQNFTDEVQDFTNRSEITQFSSFADYLSTEIGIGRLNEKSQTHYSADQVTYLLKDIATGIQDFSDSSFELISTLTNGSSAEASKKAIREVDLLADSLVDDKQIKIRFQNMTSRLNESFKAFIQSLL